MSRHFKLCCTSALLLSVFVAYLVTLCRGANAAQPARVEHKQSEITWRMKPRPSLRVISGNLVYEEHLLEGGLRTRFWSPNGLIKPDADLEPGSRAGELPSLTSPLLVPSAWRSTDRTSGTAGNGNRQRRFPVQGAVVAT